MKFNRGFTALPVTNGMLLVGLVISQRAKTLRSDSNVSSSCRRSLTHLRLLDEIRDFSALCVPYACIEINVQVFMSVVLIIHDHIRKVVLACGAMKPLYSITVILSNRSANQ